MNATPEYLRTIWFNAIINMPVSFTPATASKAKSSADIPMA